MVGRIDDGQIVVGIDSAENSDEALMWAADTAALRGVPLVLTHALASPSTQRGSQDITAERVHAVAEALLVAKRDAVYDVHPQLEVHLEMTPSNPADAMLARAQGAALLVVGSRHRGPVGRLFLGSVSHAAVTQSPIPVAVVRHRAADSDGPVVVGVEASEDCDVSLEYAFREAADRKVALHAVRAWMPDIAIGYGIAVLDSEVLPTLLADEQSALEATVNKHAAEHPEVELRTAVVEGDPTTVLVGAAANAQLVVIGTHSRGPLGRIFLGSVSTNVLHAVEIPVVVVPGKHPVVD
ncbi:MAG: universal stress protein [Candidatus Nanopelagicales bacterium]